MAQIGFTASITSTIASGWLDQLVADEIENQDVMILVRRPAPGTVTLTFLLKSGENVLFRLAKALQYILDKFVATATPFSVQTSVYERAIDAYYGRGQGNKELEDIVGWIKRVAPLYYPRLISCKMRGKTAMDSLSAEQTNVSVMLNSDANNFAVFVATVSGDGMGNITVFNRDNFTQDSIQEAIRYGCKEMDRGSSIDRETPYIDLQAMGAEFGVFVPEEEVHAMLEGTPRVYAVVPGIEKYPAMASEAYAQTGMAEVGGQHCQGDQSGNNREYVISHLVPCPGTSGGFVTGKKCESTDSAFRTKRESGKLCHPFMDHERKNDCCAIRSRGAYVDLDTLMYICAHKRVSNLSPKFSFLNDVLAWYRTVQQVKPLGETVYVLLKKEMTDKEQLLLDAKPVIINMIVGLPPHEFVTLDTFFARAENLNPRQIHTFMCGMEPIDDFSLDKTFDFLKVNRPKLEFTMSIGRERSSELPSVRQVATFVEKMFHAKEFERFQFILSIEGEIPDSRSIFSSK